MRWPDEIRDPAELLAPPAGVAEEEIARALALTDTMTVDRPEGRSSEAIPRKPLSRLKQRSSTFRRAVELPVDAW
ncbi:hypothetical protein AB0E62_28765 [Streptomyces sp. NPDC038707]|uniref:hypothetical protein n=1 Tax=Streptomyces sp. NPDC038707 TaxID=3154329 RepID=UPI0033C560A2